MGRGDKKTAKGKIFKGSFGNSRPKARKLVKAKKLANPVAAKETTAAKKKTVTKKK